MVHFSLLFWIVRLKAVCACACSTWYWRNYIRIATVVWYAGLTYPKWSMSNCHNEPAENIQTELLSQKKRQLLPNFRRHFLNWMRSSSMASRATVCVAWNGFSLEKLMAHSHAHYRRKHFLCWSSAGSAAAQSFCVCVGNWLIQYGKWIYLWFRECDMKFRSLRRTLNELRSIRMTQKRARCNDLVSQLLANSD